MKSWISRVLLAISLLVTSVVYGAEDTPAPVTDNFNLSDYAGKPVYVDFWASWCGPCRASFPFMADMVEQFGDELAIVAINVDENQVDADEFLAEFETPFDIVYDPEGTLASLFKVPGMPTTYLYDHEGNFIERHIGFKRADEDAIRDKVRAAIEASAATLQNDTQ